jgi:hypothetical protein
MAAAGRKIAALMRLRLANEAERANAAKPVLHIAPPELRPPSTKSQSPIVLRSRASGVRAKQGNQPSHVGS